LTTKTDLLKAIRGRCLDCCCYQPSEVAKCPSTGCSLWLFRFGRDPTPARGRSAENLAPVGEIFGKKRPSREEPESGKGGR
jgi:hypothetical protein